MRTLEFVIAPEDEGLTVEQFLRGRQGFPRKRVVKLKHDPLGMLCNGEHARSIDLLQAGDRLTVRFALEEQAPVPAGEGVFAPVRYEDEDVLVFDKPPEMPVHPSTRHYDDTLANVYASLCAERGEQLAFRPINRLDRDTTGLVVTGKNPLSAAFLWKAVEKEYFALVCGQVAGEKGVIDLPIGREDKSIIKREVRPDGRRAVTHYQVLGRGREYTALSIRLETGRTHQIRVHFSHLGHPLAGDTLYGSDSRYIGRHALHCRAVWFPTLAGETRRVESPLPEDIVGLLERDGIALPEKSCISFAENP